MIVMPQLYQHEILFCAHDAMGHQGISKVVARIQERNTWPGIRRTVGEYVSQCLTRANRSETSPKTYASTSKTFKVDILMSWCNMIT